MQHRGLMSRRARGRTAFAFCGALILAAAGGCGSPLSTDDAAPQRFIEAPIVSSAAREKFGGRADEAYQELARFSIDEWLVPALVDPVAPAPPPEALSDGIVQHLDPATVPHWQNSVIAALQGNAAEVGTVRMLRFYDLQAPTLKLPDGGKSPISGESITGGTVELGQVRADGITPLVVTFRQRARLNLMKGRSPYAVKLRKKVTLTVVPSEQAATSASSPGASPTGASLALPPHPDRKWLITTFIGDITTSDAGEDSPGDDEPAEN